MHFTMKIPDIMDAQPKFSNDFQALPKDHQLSSQILGKIKDFPKLSRLQCGHLRHFYNLASTIDGDWGLLGSQEPGQEWDTAYRYQLSAMTYAAGAAYYHRLPVARSMFKELIEKLISKMLRREVWGYWYMTSQSGINANPDIKELRKPWADPVCKENIMVSLFPCCYWADAEHRNIVFGTSSSYDKPLYDAIPRPALR